MRCAAAYHSGSLTLVSDESTKFGGDLSTNCAYGNAVYDAFNSMLDKRYLVNVSSGLGLGLGLGLLESASRRASP